MRNCAIVPDFETGNGLRSLLSVKQWCILIAGSQLATYFQEFFSNVIFLDGWDKPFKSKEEAEAWANYLEQKHMIGTGYVLRNKEKPK